MNYFIAFCYLLQRETKSLFTAHRASEAQFVSVFLCRTFNAILIIVRLFNIYYTCR